jgi:hypothetical protein
VPVRRSFFCSRIERRSGSIFIDLVCHLDPQVLRQSSFSPIHTLPLFVRASTAPDSSLSQVIFCSRSSVLPRSFGFGDFCFWAVAENRQSSSLPRRVSPPGLHSQSAATAALRFFFVSFSQAAAFGLCCRCGWCLPPFIYRASQLCVDSCKV